MSVAAGLGLLVPPDNFTIPPNYSTTVTPQIDDQNNATISDFWEGSVLSGTSINDFQYESTFQTLPTIEQAEPPPLLSPGVLLSALNGPWSRILTSFIFICTVFLLALLCFSLAIILLIAFRRLWSYGVHGDKRRNSMFDPAVYFKYSPATAIISPNWISPPAILPSPIPYPPPAPVQSKLPKSSAQFYPAKCTEIAAIAKMAKVNAPSAEPSEPIYMDIEPKGQAKERPEPVPPPRSKKKVTTSPSCYVTSIEDDASHAEEARIKEQPYANTRYYPMSMPWFNQHQFIQPRVRPSLNLSEANLRNAKASLKSTFPLSQTLSMMDPNAGMMDCYSSYSEVVMELKSKFSSQLSKKLTIKKENV